MTAPDGSCPVVLLVSLLRHYGFNKKAGYFGCLNAKGLGDATVARAGRMAGVAAVAAVERERIVRTPRPGRMSQSRTGSLYAGDQAAVALRHQDDAFAAAGGAIAASDARAVRPVGVDDVVVYRGALPPPPDSLESCPA
jgi:hypothetical protein